MLKNPQGRPTLPAMGDLGTFVRAKRKERGLTLQQLAEIAGVTESAISMIELGQRKKLQVSTVIGLSKGLDVTTEDLLSHVDCSVPA